MAAPRKLSCMRVKVAASEGKTKGAGRLTGVPLKKSGTVGSVFQSIKSLPMLVPPPASPPPVLMAPPPVPSPPVSPALLLAGPPGGAASRLGEITPPPPPTSRDVIQPGTLRIVVGVILAT